MLTPTATRVNEHTAPEINRMISLETQANIMFAIKHPEHIDQRLKELDHEWDVERALETGSSVVTLCGLVLGYFVHTYWFFWPVAVQLFFLQHALQGWCPPLPLLRHSGFRTEKEIQYERNMLKTIKSGTTVKVKYN